VLTEVLPAAIPITAVYHFRQFGAFQPYLGLGFEPSFLLALRSGFSTGGSYEPSVGLVLQGGFDYMFGPHWGVFAEVKKIFAESTGHATGVDFGPPVGVVPVDSTIKTSGQPWLVTAGLAYRF
jgi:outer membrane protein